MASLNQITQKWHAYTGSGAKRIHLGYYRTKEEALEAEKLGRKTDKVWTRDDSREVKASKIHDSLVSRLDKNQQDGPR